MVNKGGVAMAPKKNCWHTMARNTVTWSELEVLAQLSRHVAVSPAADSLNPENKFTVHNTANVLLTLLI